MNIKCVKCGYVTVFTLRNVRDVKAPFVQTDIFGGQEEITVGRIKCKHCGSYIYTKSKSELKEDKK